MNRRRLSCFCLLWIALGTFLPATEAGRFALLVNDVSDVAEPWPLVGGLPFPRGVIKDGAAVRITSGGREVAAQLDVAVERRL